MRRFVVSLLVLTLAVSAVESTAVAKPKEETGAADPKKDPYAIPQMKPTKIPEFDAFFERGKAPIESLITSRKRIDMAQSRMKTAVGLGQEVTLKSALEEFKKRLETKTRVGLKKGKIPTFTVADAVPDDLQHMVDEFNASIGEIDNAFGQLESIKGELSTLATEAIELPGKAPEAAKSAGLSATEVPAAIKNTGTNSKTLGTSKDESEALFTSVNSMVTDMEAVFGAALD